MGAACSAYGEEERPWWGNLKKRDHLRDPGLDGRLILKLCGFRPGEK